MNYFRSRQRQISAVAVTLLLGGWFAVVCQNCMAHTNQIDTSLELAISNHCDEAEESKLNSSNEFCEELCDCGAVASNIKNNPKVEFYLPFEQETSFFSSVIDKNLFIANQVLYIPNHSPPECPQLSPINTYCVQIK